MKKIHKKKVVANGKLIKQSISNSAKSLARDMHSWRRRDKYYKRQTQQKRWEDECTLLGFVSLYSVMFVCWINLSCRWEHCVWIYFSAAGVCWLENLWVDSTGWNLINWCETRTVNWKCRFLKCLQHKGVKVWHNWILLSIQVITIEQIEMSQICSFFQECAAIKGLIQFWLWLYSK